MSIVRNRTRSVSDSEILLESFSDEEDNNNKKGISNNEKDNIEDKNNAKMELNSPVIDDEVKFNKDSPDFKGNHDAAEIRRLLRRKDELLRKQKMQERFDERLQVSIQIFL